MTVGPGARAPAAGRRRGTVGSVPSAPSREPQRTHTARAHTPLTPKDTHGAYAHSAHAHVRALPKAGGVPCQALALKLCQVDEHGMKHGTAITWDE